MFRLRGRAELRVPSVFFDVDDTLLCWDKRLRSHAREVVAATHAMGFDVYVWSGVGLRWEVIDVHGLRPYVKDCFRKPLSRYVERLEEMGIPFVPDHVVDDDAEIVEAFGGTLVQAPLSPAIADGALLVVLDELRERFPCMTGAPE